MTHRFFFWKIWLIEIEQFFSTWVKGNDSIFWDDSEHFYFTKYMTQRIMILFFLVKWWPKEFFLKKNKILRIELLKKYDSKSWTLFFWKSKNWYLFINMTHSGNSILLNSFSTWFKELNPFSTCLKKLNPSSRIWLKELNSQNDAKFLFFGFDSKSYFHMTPRIIFSHDSKNWPFF